MTISPADPAADTWTLDASRAAVLHALADAHDKGAVTDEAAASWSEQVEQVADVLTLHALVGQNAALDQRICRYPTCFHPPRPYAGTGRRNNYCDRVRDGNGGEAHTPQTSLRERRRLERAAASSGAEVAVVKPAGPVEPVTDARRSLPERAARWEAVMNEAVTSISSQFDELKTLVRTIGDDEAAVEEIEAVREEADRRVKDAETRAKTAERRAREAQQAAQTLGSRLEEAQTAAEEADERSLEVEAEARTAAERHAQEIETANAAVEQAKADAQTAIERAAQELEEHKRQVDADRQQTLDQWKKEHDTTVEEIRKAADAKVKAAEDAATQRIAQVEADAETKIDAAEADAADARGEVDKVTQEMQRVRERAAEDRAAAQSAREQLTEVRADLKTAKEEIGALRKGLEDKDAEHRQAVKDLETRYEAQLAELRATLATRDTEHRQAVKDLETRQEQQLQRERDAFEQERIRIDGANKETLAALRSQVSTLTEALTTARTSADATVPAAAGTTKEKGGRR